MVRVRVKEQNPPLEVLDVSEIQNGPVRAREAKVEDISPPQLDKKGFSLRLAKIRSRCRSHQIFGATQLGLSFGAVCHACEGLGFPSPVPSLLVRLLLKQYLLDCC